MMHYVYPDAFKVTIFLSLDNLTPLKSHKHISNVYGSDYPLTTCSMNAVAGY